MQYLLTQEEYDKLTKKMQSLCSKIADEMPIIYWGNAKAEPWGCILTSKEEHYCDECPVKEICPNPSKHWSK